MKNREVVSYKIEDTFAEKFQAEAEVVIQSPGRINIIGEHTDYNEGYVLPAAINYYTYVAVAKNHSDQINLYSVDYDESVSLSLNAIERGDNLWVNLVIGVFKPLADKIGGVNLAFGGDIPEGAGLSSSAALCCGVGMALSELFDLKLDKWDVAKIAQQSEHEFALVQCGIMDQFACMFGIDNHVLFLDCKTHEYKESKIDMSGYRLLLLNSNVKHSLGDSDYNLRKTESSNALETLKSQDASIASYQDVTLKRMEEAKYTMPEVIWKRGYHIVSENERVIKLNDEFKKGNYEAVGKLLTEGHESLKNNYEVTCEETDFIVDALNQQVNVLGARQVGGGFGGCVLALVKEGDILGMVEQIAKDYDHAFSLKLSDIPVKISQGCHRII